MIVTTEAEAFITKNNRMLVILSSIENESLIEDFCGDILHVANPSQPDAPIPSFANKTVYLCGDISMANALALSDALSVFVIDELSFDDDHTEWQTVGLGQVPLLIAGVGVFYRRFFAPSVDYFKQVCDEHTFQALTESNKPSKAQRSGIYLTPVTRDGASSDLNFRLLRCSTNLSGPTENFGPTDHDIVDALNHEAEGIFENYAALNHVLAQVYKNTPATSEQKQTKAKISSHADKTKDMPDNGIMAFCTFYNGLEKLDTMSHDAFDYGYKKTSGLTRLRFRLKRTVTQDPANPLPEIFTITLYPGSVFFMPLSTNRLYTHEIKPSGLDAERLPTRLGYVVRCSSTEAVHSDGHTYLKQRGELTKLQPATPEGVAELRSLYVEENNTHGVIDYAGKFLFSMNEGDYTAPIYELTSEF